MKLYQTVLWVAVFSYCGVLTRVLLTSLSKLSREPGSSGGDLLSKLGDGFFLPNIIGSFLLGFVQPFSEILIGQTQLYTGMASGFCGSCTTFATWNLHAIGLIMNGLWLDSFIQSLITIATSYCSLTCGGRLGQAIVEAISDKAECTNGELANHETTVKMVNSGQNEGLLKDASISIHVSETSETIMNPTQSESSDVIESGATKVVRSSKYRLVDYSTGIPLSICVLCTCLIWVLIILDQNSTRKGWWVAIAFGPLGAITRYILSLKNKDYPMFPIFTFAGNVSATVINVIILVIYESIDDSSHTTIKDYGLWVRAGLSTGAMGSLSTVSTFVSEIRKLSDKGGRFAFRYCLATIITAHCFGLIISSLFELIHHQHLFQK